MSLHKPLVFGGVSCAYVAEELKQTEESCWVFSICSDERIPDSLESKLRTLKFSELPCRMIILGDFVSIPPSRCPASFEVLRILAEVAGYIGCVNVCWIQGETICVNQPTTLDFTWYQVRYRDLPRAPVTHEILMPGDAFERETYLELTRMIGHNPVIQLSKEGLVETIFLTDRRLYQRSLISQMEEHQKELLWVLIRRFHGLKTIRAAFSGIEVAPDLTSLTSLEILDLRGNPGIKLNRLEKQTSLVHLNLAACELTSVPSFLSCFDRLQTLLLHKNKISEISNTVFPPQLKRLSLYRNRINIGILELGNCYSISIINIGANPLISLHIRLPEREHIVEIGVRNLSNPESMLDLVCMDGINFTN